MLTIIGMPDEKSTVAEPSTSLLLVEDDEILLAGLARQLATPGVHVVTANSGQVAMRELAIQPFDVMISDIRMPGMTGLKLLRAVRECDMDLPVILMTGDPDLRTAAAAVEYGAFQYLIKPIQVERLQSMVAQAANMGRLGRLQRELSARSVGDGLPIGDRAGIEAALESALNSMWMVYQPIVDTFTSELLGREALLRAQQALLAFPRLILGAAERLHRLYDVGRAVRELVAFDIQHSPEGSLFFVNLHSEDLLDPYLYVPAAALSSVASRVVLELPEHGAFERVDGLAEKLERLRDVGFRIALDDLGTGSAGTGLFRSLDPEFVKLDISLIRGIHRDPSRQSILRSMVHVCHDLGKRLIAEGVETLEEQAVLREFECDFLQGYLLGKPERLSCDPSEHARPAEVRQSRSS